MGLTSRVQSVQRSADVVMQVEVTTPADPTGDDRSHPESVMTGRTAIGSEPAEAPLLLPG